MTNPRSIFTNDNWIRKSENPVLNLTGVGRRRNRGKLWELECAFCGAERTLSTSQVNADASKCHCRVKGNVSLTLAYKGVTQPIKHWKRLYPIVETTVRDRSSRRSKGIMPYAEFTDAQILFGKAGEPTDLSEFDELEQDAKSRDHELNDLTAYAMLHMGKYFHELMRTTVLTYIAKEKQNLKDNPEPDKAYLAIAGADFEVNGSTLAEYLEMGMDVEELLEFVRMEEYADVSDKVLALSPFIVVDKSSLVITHAETLMLFSTISLLDL